MDDSERCRRILQRKLREAVKAKDEVIITLEDQVKQIESEIGLTQGGQFKDEQFKELNARLDCFLDSLEQLNDSHGDHRDNTVPKQLAAPAPPRPVEGDSTPGGLADSGDNIPRIGFTAFSGESASVKEGRMTNFTDIFCNEGDCYNGKEGHFKVPRDGLYFLSVTSRQKFEGVISVCAVKPPSQKNKTDKVLCRVVTYDDENFNSGVAVAKLDKGDEVCLKAGVKDFPKLTCFSSFTCFLIR